MKNVYLTPEQFLTYPIVINPYYTRMLHETIQKSKALPEFLRDQWKTMPPEQKKLQKTLYYRMKKALNHFTLKIKKQQIVFRNSFIIKLLGCTPPEYRRHIASQFKEGMTWENYGKQGWFVQHILPNHYFNLSDPVELKQYMHYTNLRPCLWKDHYNLHGSVYRKRQDSDLSLS